MHLSLEAVQKSFDQKLILDDISFVVNQGEFVSLIGPSGSGKTTLFNLIGGLLEPEQGKIELNGQSIIGESGHISYMPQQHALMPWRSILDNVILGQELYGKVDLIKAREMLAFAGLGDVINAYPDELSGGMKQRASFIRALLSPQTLLCLDEPFSALDEFTRLDMQKWLLKTWQAYQQSILFITHSVEEALFLSDKIIMLSSGPAQVKAVIDVPFPRPRDEAILLSDEFLKVKRQVLDVLVI